MKDTELQSLSSRIGFAVTLMMVMGIGPSVVYAIGILAPFIALDLGLSRIALGSISGFSYFVAAVVARTVGRLIDNRQGRIMASWCFAWAALASLVAAISSTLITLHAAAGLAGLAMGTGTSLTNRLVASHIPAGKRGTQIGLKQSGPPLGQALIGFGMPTLSLILGWRGSALVGAAIAFVGLAVGLLVIPRDGDFVRSQQDTKAVRSDREQLWAAAYGFCLAFPSTTMVMYIALFAYEDLQLAPHVAGMTGAVMGVTGVIARIIWARRAERSDHPILALALLAVGAALAIFLLMLSPVLGSRYLWLGVVGFGLTGWSANAVIMVAVIRNSAPGTTGQNSGVVGTGLYVGFMLGPLFFGSIVDQTNSYAVGWLVASIICLVGGLVAIGWHRAVIRAAWERR